MDLFNTMKFLIMGSFFGLTAGISPGPLLTLVITETLHHNKKEGIKVALAPLITDLPIIILICLIFFELSDFHVLLGIISILGAAFLAYLGYNTLKIKEIQTERKGSAPASLKKAVLANILNPNPYLFWLTVGVPSAMEAYQVNLLGTIFFFLFFYIFLVGSKILVALLVQHSKAFLHHKFYSWVMRIMGLALLIFSLFFLYDGYRFLTGLSRIAY